MITLLIDISSIKRGIKKNEFNTNIENLLKWVQKNEIQILAPEMLLNEWAKHKEIETSQIKKSAQSLFKNIKTFSTKKELNNYSYSLGELRLIKQIEIIDKILNQFATSIQESNETKIKIVENKRKEIFPFSHNKNAENDVSIIYSSLDFCKQNNINTLYFISSNTNDFCKLEGEKNILHPEINQIEKTINVKYFTTIEEFIKETAENEKIFTNLEQQKKQINRLLSEPNVDIYSSIVDKIYFFLNQINYDLKNLSPDNWAFFPPFKIGNKPYFTYEMFTLYTDNVELFNFFENLNFGNSISHKSNKYADIDHLESKTKYIVNTLNDCLVFEIALQNENKFLNIKSSTINEDSYIEDLQNFNFSKLIKKQENSEIVAANDPEAVGYFHYKFGFHEEAFSLYTKQYKKENLSDFERFKTEYNLINLYKSSWSFEEATSKEHATIYHKIIDDYNLNNLPSFKDINLKKWLANNIFFNEIYYEVEEIQKKILDFYQQIQNGNTGHNLHIWNIYEKIARIEKIISSNRLIFEEFKEFSFLIDKFIECLFASYSLPKYISSRIEYFDDWIISIIACHGIPESIFNYKLKYNISKINYEETGFLGNNFSSYFENFIDSIIKIDINSPNSNLNNKFHFHNKINKILSNFLILGSIIKIEKKKFKHFENQIIRFLSHDHKVNFTNSHKYLAFFIYKNIKYISKSGGLRIFDLTINAKQFHTEIIKEAILTLAIRKNINKEEVKKNTVLNSLLKLENCPICNSKLPFEYLYLINTLYFDNNSELQKIIYNKLQLQFDWRLYYYASVFDVIEFNEELFCKFVKSTETSNNPISFFSFKSNEPKRNYRMNAVINLSLKYNYNLANPIYDHLKCFDPYYDWLLDIENFDYLKFSPDWVCENLTKFTINYFRKGKKLKRKLKKYISQKNDTKINSAFLKIYYT